MAAKAAGIILGNFLHPIAVERHAGEIKALRITVKFLHLGRGFPCGPYPRAL
jgi:hypothetical protein